jgi:hypothetical protein
MYLRTCGSFKPANRKTTSNKSANHKKDWIHKSQIYKVPHLRMVRKYNK